MADHVSIRLHHGGTFTVRFSAGKIDALSSWQEKLHNNAEWEFHLILKGSSRFQGSSLVSDLHPGDLVLIAPGVYHSAQNDVGTFQRLTLSVTAENHASEALLRAKTDTCRVFRSSDESRKIADLLLRECREHQNQTVEEALLTVIFSQFLRVVGVSDRKPSTPGGPHALRTEILDAYFPHHLKDGANEQELADLVGLSRRQLVRVLQKTYGMTFREKLLSTRMNQSAQLLTSTNLPVSEIIDSVGYASETAFFNQFQKTFGMTPAKYRKSHQ